MYMPAHVYTSIVSNYIPKARVLAHSVKKFHPDLQFHLVLSDTLPSSFRLEHEPFDSVLTPADLDIPNLGQWLFLHSLVEVSTGVKGFALLKLLKDPSCSEVIFFDPDIVVLSPLDGLLTRFRDGSILLTPHQTEPETEPDAVIDNEICSLRHGVYNLGFLGVKNSPVGRQFAEWWRDRLHSHCYDDIPAGLFTDQRWADLAPALFPECLILRDPTAVNPWCFTTSPGSTVARSRLC